MGHKKDKKDKKGKKDKKSGKDVLYLRLGDLLIRESSNKYPVSHHNYYKALVLGDSDLYEEQAAKSEHQRNKPSSSWENFVELGKNIKKNGYKPGSHPLKIKIKENNWYFTHGRHRACLLLYLYGPNVTLVVEQHKEEGHIVAIET